MWLLDGQKLRARREANGMSRIDLARTSGVGERTLCRLEGPGAREVRVTTLAVLAQALGTSPSALAEHTEDTAVPATQPKKTSDNPLMRPSRLAALADIEREAGGVAQVATSIGTIERLGPIRLNQIYSSYTSYAGATWLVEGIVASDRGVPVAEATLMGVTPGASTRLRVVQAIGNHELSVTVVVSGAALVRDVHDLSARGERVLLAARVVVAPGDVPSFWTHESETKRPWVLVATEPVTLSAPTPSKTSSARQTRVTPKRRR